VNLIILIEFIPLVGLYNIFNTIFKYLSLKSKLNIKILKIKKLNQNNILNITKINTYYH